MALKGRQEVQSLLFNSNINVMTCNFRKDGFLLKPLIIVLACHTKISDLYILVNFGEKNNFFSCIEFINLDY